ncbi:histidine kinase [Pararhodobacter marinus]|uniref:Histidine kinase n=1 Tax=Pararhodobacter marinus TaxID=2184063 RepID=A0A2U2CCI2_9RHOB|nr:DUF1801 domain-containing protein [Pararhodobacter marinus]PWE29569.1 histidine kinase [Pararhodobacter marinus]
MAKPRLLTGGNPQIPKGLGDAPVRAYIDALEGWKRQACEDLDRVISRSIPGVRKAVKWNSPFYGPAGGDYVVSYHVMTRYVKVAFFAGASLDPPPPEGSKDPSTRYLHVSEKAPLDEARLADWCRQASALPGFGKVAD